MIAPTSKLASKTNKSVFVLIFLCLLSFLSIPVFHFENQNNQHKQDHVFDLVGHFQLCMDCDEEQRSYALLLHVFSVQWHILEKLQNLFNSQFIVSTILFSLKSCIRHKTAPLVPPPII